MAELNVDRVIRRALTVEWDGCRPEQWGDFCVVDGARSREIHDAVHRAGEESVCLYDGQLPPVLAQAAPYLVRLHADSRFTQLFYTKGWGRAWGIVVRASSSLGAMRRHLRTLSYVKAPAGRAGGLETRKLLFRFYDPRVLRSFLPTCDRRQLELFFGPIGAIVLEDASSPDVLTFHRDRHGALVVERTPPPP